MWQLLSMFSGPLSSLAERLILTGVTSAVSYGVGKGYLQAGDSATIVAGLVAIGSSVTGMLKATAQGKIASVVNNQTNGVTVVPATPANRAQTVTRPLT